MNDKVLYWGSTVFGALALVILVANVCFVNGNRNLQATLAQRQAVLNNAPNMNQVNQALVQALAQAAVNDDDKEIRDLLTSQGFTIKSKAGSSEKTDKNEKEKKK